MNYLKNVAVLLALTMSMIPEQAFARGRGGGGGIGGRVGGGGGGVHPSFGGGGGRPSFGGGASGGHPNFSGPGGSGSRPNFGNVPNHSPSFSHPIGGGTSRPSFGAGDRPNFGAGNRPNVGGGNFGLANRPNIGEGGFGGGNRPNIRPDGGKRPEIGGGNRPNNPIISGETLHPRNRPNGGGSGLRPNINGGNTNIGNRTHIGGGIGNNTNFGHIGNNNFNNIHNNINIATNRPYYNNWQHGNWNGNWNRPGGGGYWNGYAHGFANGYSRGYWNGGWGGYWHGGWGGSGYWGRPWYAAPIAWGLGTWAIGSIFYNSGYGTYNNPYYAVNTSAPAYYDYSQPITVINQQPQTSTAAFVDPSSTGDATSPPAEAPTPEIQAGTTHMDLARDAFKTGDYATASREVDLAIQNLPKDAALHEFRALIFFATKDYSQSAATLYAVLSAGPGWDWTTLSGMYADITAYTGQLRALEDYVKANPSSADARFVVAYHYLTCGYNDAAIAQYKEVEKLQPSDKLTPQLLSMLDSDTPATTAGDPPAPSSAADTPQAVAPPSIDAGKIVGKWTAKKSSGPTFVLDLTTDSKFTWDYEQNGKHEKFGGKYSVDDAILVLERSDGAQMPGIVTMADNGFNFKLYGGPPDDQGLDFSK